MFERAVSPPILPGRFGYYAPIASILDRESEEH
jgi:hypothetical protein